MQLLRHKSSDGVHCTVCHFLSYTIYTTHSRLVLPGMKGQLVLLMFHAFTIPLLQAHVFLLLVVVGRVIGV